MAQPDSAGARQTRTDPRERNRITFKPKVGILRSARAADVNNAQRLLLLQHLNFSAINSKHLEQVRTENVIKKQHNAGCDRALQRKLKYAQKPKWKFLPVHFEI